MNDMTGQPLIDPHKPDVAAVLRRMADHLDRNKDVDFGGCAVIVPPSTNETIEVLILDSKGDAAQFLSTILTRIQNIQVDMQVVAKRQQTFGRGY